MATPIALPLAADERVLAQVDYQAYSRSARFVMAVTNRALLIRRKRRFSVGDPHFLQRIELGDVRTVFVKRLAAWGWYMLAPVLVAVGAYASYVVYWPILQGAGGRVTIWPAVLTGIGLFLPFAARRRFGLGITSVNGRFTWRPEFFVGRGPSEQQHVMSTLVEAIRAVGVPVVDERAAT